MKNIFLGLKKLRRIIMLESGPLSSVLVLLLIILLISSIALYFLERNAQPDTFGSIPDAIWWAVVTLTTTGYGDKVPVTLLGRLVAGIVSVSGLCVFGLWTGILATAFASEMKRDNFLKTWDTVSKVPFFTNLGPSLIAEITQMLRVVDMPSRSTVIRKGQRADCMYFIASGEVAVELPGNNVKLGEGAFFGEMALISNSPRGANISTTKETTLLVLDLADFRLLMARNPELAETIDAEAKRRTIENK